MATNTKIIVLCFILLLQYILRAFVPRSLKLQRKYFSYINCCHYYTYIIYSDFLL